MSRFRRCAVVVFVILIYILPLSGCEHIQEDPPIAPKQATEDIKASNINELPEVSESMDRHPVTILFFSDTQADPEMGDYSGFGDMLAQATEANASPDLAIFGGDTVNDGGDENEWREFKTAIGKKLDGFATAAIAGNHDSYPLLAEQFDNPDKAPMEQGRGYFYTLSIGPVFFIMLDSNIMGAANPTDIEWLQNELRSEAAQQAEWRIAVMHHPMWPVNDDPKDLQRAETMRENFLPLLEANGVTLILCGHQHVYARTLPMSGGAVADDGRGITQIMAASGDKATYAPGKRDYIEKSAPAPNYLLLKADDQSLTVTAFDGEGSVIDQLIIYATNARE